MSDIEKELVACPTCSGLGSLKGERCPECVGRGVIRVPHAEVVIDDEPAEGDGPALKSLLKADVVEIAEKRGLDTTGTKAEIVARIEAADAAPADDEPAEGEEGDGEGDEEPQGEN